jgi:cyclase
MGEPVELAQRYSDLGADELVLLDISATVEERATTVQLVREIAKVLKIPFTVGGGISSREDVSRLLMAGADKIVLNSAAVRAPQLITELAQEFGSQCIVVAVDSKRTGLGNEVFTHAGRRASGRISQQWCDEVVQRGAGEIVLTSIDHDGVRAGFALELVSQVSTSVSVPVIASGGAGEVQHFVDVFHQGQADGALAAGIFHEDTIQIAALKRFLKECEIEVRV